MAEKEYNYIELEKQYQESLEMQKRYYESEIELLKSKYKYEIEKVKIECENKSYEEKKVLEQNFDVKNTQDLEKIKQYYISEFESQRNWYEKEIKRRCKEVEDWHINNLKNQMDNLKKDYEEELQAKDDRYKNLEETLSNHIIEQREYFEKEIKPFKKLIKLKKKIVNKLKNKEKEKHNNN